MTQTLSCTQALKLPPIGKRQAQAMKLYPFSKHPMDDGHSNSLNKMDEKRPNTNREIVAGPPSLDNKHAKIINGENEP